MTQQVPSGSTAGYVFTTAQGGPIDPTNLTRAFTTLLRKAGLRRIRFHDLRHSTATLLLEQGVELVVIKELLGHAHIGVTATVYAHVRLRLQRDAIDTLGSALDGPTVAERPAPTATNRRLRSPRPLTLPSTTAVTHRRSPARTHLTGLQICASVLPYVAQRLGRIDSGGRSVTLRPSTARRSIVGGQSCSVRVWNRPPTESHRKIRLQRT